MSSFLRNTGFIAFLAVVVLVGLYTIRSYRDDISASMANIQPAAGDDAGQQDLIGSFFLTDQDGASVTEKNYPGQYRLIFFGFTNCPDTCPTGLKKMARAMELLKDDAGLVKPLFITVDPKNDTPDVMRAYTAQFDARLTGLTGTPEQIEAAEKSFKVYASEQPLDEGEGHNGHPHVMVDHSAFIYLQDPEGRLIDFFGTDESAEDIAGAVKAVLDNG